MRSQVHGINQQQDDGDEDANGLDAPTILNDQGGGGRNGERGQHQYHHSGIFSGITSIEVLFAPAPTAEGQRGTEDEQHIADDRADDRGFNNGDQPLLQREDADNNFGGITEGCIEQAASDVTNMRCEVFSGKANQRGEGDQADGRANKDGQFLPLPPREFDNGRKDGCYQQEIKPAWHDLPIYKTKASLCVDFFRCFCGLLCFVCIDYANGNFGMHLLRDPYGHLKSAERANRVRHFNSAAIKGDALGFIQASGDILAGDRSIETPLAPNPGLQGLAKELLSCGRTPRREKSEQVSSPSSMIRRIVYTLYIASASF